MSLINSQILESFKNAMKNNSALNKSALFN